MSIVEDIKSEIKECMKSGNSFARDILKTLLGEIQLVESRTGKMNDESAIKVIKKFRDGATEMYYALVDRGSDDSERLGEISRERIMYDAFIPVTLDVDEIIFILDSNEAILAAKSDGQATGVAMGILKKEGLAVDGKDVSEAVKKIRAASEDSE